MPTGEKVRCRMLLDASNSYDRYSNGMTRACAGGALEPVVVACNFVPRIYTYVAACIFAEAESRRCTSCRPFLETPSSTSGDKF